MNFTNVPTYLRVKIIPKSPSNEIGEKMADGTLKIRIAAPAEKGKTNKELIAFLANTWKIPKDQIAIISGHTSRLKLLRITPVIARSEDVLATERSLRRQGSNLKARASKQFLT